MNLAAARETRWWAELVLFEYVNEFYNLCERYSLIAGKSPAAFEKPAA